MEKIATNSKFVAKKLIWGGGLFIALSLISLVPNEASATPPFCGPTAVVLLPESEVSGATAHVLELLDTTACTSACAISSLRRVFIEFQDKQLYAAALTASTQGGTYYVSWETTGSTYKGGDTHNVYACRLLSIWKS